MSVIHAPRKPQIGLRQLAILGIILGAILVLFLRLWYLQVVKAADLQQTGAVRKDTVSILPPRGLIVDRRGKLLAGVRSVVAVTAIPDTLRKNPDVEQRLATILGSTAGKIEDKLQAGRWRPYLPTPVFVGATMQTATKIAEESDSLPGVDVQLQPLRYYPDAHDFSHILGYVWTPSDRDVKRLASMQIKPNDYVGKLNVEAIYEPELMGQPGQDLMQVDVKGKPQRVLDRANPEAGNKLVLSIDSDLQKLAEDELSSVIERQSHSGGAAVALDPNTGEILCMASSPTFDTSLFESGISASDYSSLRDDPMRPMFNRAVAGVYSPGSTFKIVTTLAAIKAGTLDTRRTVFCPGYYQVGNRKVKCLGHHGYISFHEALEKSCNTYFADLAYRTGPVALKKTALDLGFGQKSGVDVSGESKAVVPTDDWIRSVRKLPADAPAPWYPGDTVNMGIGQGELGVTPMQMADLIATVANEGDCYQPHLVRATIDGEGETHKIEPKLLHHIDETPETWETLRSALTDVIRAGTARHARIPGLEWAGKTGSTEHNHKEGKTHSWFVGFAPLDHPRIAVCVLVEEAGHGGEVAAPIAAKIVQAYLGLGVESKAESGQ